MITISLCMIVKNEEKVLARCLDSIKDAVDEIIIADTGSTDDTKQIASRYTEHVFDFEWVDNFAAARNFSFSKATMDFVMWLDADDILTPDDRNALIRLKEELPDTADVVMMPYHTAFDEDGKPVFSYYRERIIRRSIPFEWKGRVHEAIVHSGNLFYADTPAVTHKSVKTSYSDRNLRIYERQIQDGETLEPRDVFYYGRELYYHKHYDRAIHILTGFLSDGKGWIENNIEACRILSYCHQAQGEIYRALDSLMRSFVYDSPRAEVCCEIGSLFLQLQNYRTSIFWYELALTIPKNSASGAFVSEDSYGYLPCIQLCVCYDRLGDIGRAEEYNRRAGAFRPSSPAFLQNLKYFKQKHHSFTSD